MTDHKNDPIEDLVGFTAVEDDGLTWPLPKLAAHDATERPAGTPAKGRSEVPAVARARDEAARLRALLAGR